MAVEIFNSKYRHGDQEVRFTRAELLTVASRIGVQIKNPGDFPYYYSKRHILPEQLRQAGFINVEIVGHSLYAFTKSSDAIEVPAGLPEVEMALTLPSRVRRYITDDEQGMLVKVRESDILSDFLGEKTFHLQSHLRTESKALGQVEIDDVYVTEETGKICTVEAAEPNERMVRSQVRRQLAGAETRFGVSSSHVVPVVIRILGPDKLVALRLGPALEVEAGKVYRFREPRG